MTNDASGSREHDVESATDSSADATAPQDPTAPGTAGTSQAPDQPDPEPGGDGSTVKPDNWLNP